MNSDLEGFIDLLTEIAFTEKSTTHKEIRSWARASKAAIACLELPIEIENKISFLLSCLAAGGVPHYDRAACAAKTLEILKNYKITLKNQSQSQFSAF